MIEIHRCPNSGAPLKTCQSKDFASIKVTKQTSPTIPHWFPIWNKTEAGEKYGMYWLVTDIWWTSNSDFKLQVSNLRFFKDDGSEWKLPMYDVPAPKVADDEVVV